MSGFRRWWRRWFVRPRTTQEIFYDLRRLTMTGDKYARQRGVLFQELLNLSKGD